MSIDRMLQLKALHLYGMVAAWNEWQTEYSHQQKPVIPEVWLDRLNAAEQADRQAHSLNYQLKAAHFPIHRDLLKIDCTETPLQQGKAGNLAKKLTAMDAAILDELCYLTFPASDGGFTVSLDQSAL